MSIRTYKLKFCDVSQQNTNKINEYIKFRLLNTKSESTTISDKQSLRKLANYLKEKPFEQTTETDLQQFFSDILETSAWNTRDKDGTVFIQFYRWLQKLKKRQRPPQMEWFEYTTKNAKERTKDPNKREHSYITNEEYETIINTCYDAYGHDKALFETYYLSGGRLGEVINMKIEDVVILPDGHVEIVFKHSKTIPRKVPLEDTPEHLLRWLGNHPLHGQPDAPLWLTYSKSSRNKPLKDYSVEWKLNDIKKRCPNLKKTITIHCFRKTRATIMFDRYDDGEMAKLFGWSPQTVVQRREEYDLRGHEELQRKVFAKLTKHKDYDALEREKNSIEKSLSQRVANLEKHINLLKQTIESTEREHGAKDVKIADDGSITISY